MLATAVSGPLLVWWWAALGAGLVVAVVVLLLLHRLLQVVRQIEDGAEAVWATGKDVARNTATTWMLDATGSTLDGLHAEMARHETLLSGEA